MLAQDAGEAFPVEITSETDFAAKDENFLAFASGVAHSALASGAADAEALKVAPLGGETVEQARVALIAKIGENVQVRRMLRVDSANNVVGYVHGGRVGMLVEVNGCDAELSKGLAMHIASMNPPYITGKDSRPISAPLVPRTSRAGQIRSGLRYYLADGGHLEDPAIAVWEGRGRGCQAQTAVLPL